MSVLKVKVVDRGIAVVPERLEEFLEVMRDAGIQDGNFILYLRDTSNVPLGDARVIVVASQGIAVHLFSHLHPHNNCYRRALLYATDPHQVCIVEGVAMSAGAGLMKKFLRSRYVTAWVHPARPKSPTRPAHVGTPQWGLREQAPRGFLSAWIRNPDNRARVVQEFRRLVGRGELDTISRKALFRLLQELTGVYIPASTFTFVVQKCGLFRRYHYGTNEAWFGLVSDEG